LAGFLTVALQKLATMINDIVSQVRLAGWASVGQGGALLEMFESQKRKNPLLRVFVRFKIVDLER
jgi:hypothetical protein